MKQDGGYQVSLRLSLDPDFAEAHCREGDLCQLANDIDAAIACYRKAIALQPGYARAHHNLGSALQRAGWLDAALASYQAALALLPGHAATLHNLGNLLQRQGKYTEAVAQYRALLAVRPDHPVGIGQLVHLRQLLCDWGDYEGDRRALSAAALAGSRDLMFLLRAAGPDPATMLACARRAAAGQEAARREAFADHPGTARARLRIGYLSCDLREHPVGRMLAGVLERHDREHFEVFAYSHGPSQPGPLRHRLAEAVDGFVDLAGLSDAAAARRIHADGIDILIDLNGFTAGERPGILARRPAAVQAGYLGYLGTMGGPDLDYVIADAFAVPAAHQPFYSERIVHLPHSYLPVDVAPVRQASRREVGLPEDGFVFCCFNNSYKITPDVFAVWMRLLLGVPGSLLWLVAERPQIEANLRREAAARGVAADRLVFAPRLPLQDYLARFAAADLFLDTTPCSACTTAVDALAAGLPILTRAGQIFAGRHAGSLLHAAGLAELVTASHGEYEALGLRLAREPAMLAGLRARLARAAPAFDIALHVRGLEAAYLRMQAIRLAGGRPLPYAVEQQA